MTNIYWPVYKNLEAEISKLSFNIHFDDNQLNVYSSKISDLILRASVEIESIAKELYKLNGGTKTNNIKYDEDAIKYLNELWLLDKKVVLISSINCFQSNKQLKPFEKNEKKTINGRLTFSWNNSYQNLKHDRANSLKFGNVKYLFDIMSALFVLNLYFKDESFDFEKDGKATNFPINMGSEIFAIKLHKWSSYDAKGVYTKNTDFDECLYLTKMTDNSHKLMVDANKEPHQKDLELFTKHPKFLKYIQTNDIKNYTGKNLMWDVLEKEDYIRLIKQSGVKQIEASKQSKYEGILNKNNIEILTSYR